MAFFVDPYERDIKHNRRIYNCCSPFKQSEPVMVGCRKIGESKQYCECCEHRLKCIESEYCVWCTHGVKFIHCNDCEPLSGLEVIV